MQTRKAAEDLNGKRCYSSTFGVSAVNARSARVTHEVDMTRRGGGVLSVIATESGRRRRRRIRPFCREGTSIRANEPRRASISPAPPKGISHGLRDFCAPHATNSQSPSPSLARDLRPISTRQSLRVPTRFCQCQTSCKCNTCFSSSSSRNASLRMQHRRNLQTHSLLGREEQS